MIVYKAKKAARRKHQSGVWYLISAPRRHRQQDHEFKASLGYIGSCFTKPKTKQNKQQNQKLKPTQITTTKNKNKRRYSPSPCHTHTYNASVLSWSVFHFHFYALELSPDPASPHAVVWHLDRKLELCQPCMPSATPPSPAVPASIERHAIPLLHPR